MPRPTGPVALSPAYLRAVERWEQLPENAPGSDKSWLVLAAGFAIVIGLTAGLYPALRVARLAPVEALRAL